MKTTPYQKPHIQDEGRVETLTLNSDVGTDPENFNDNIVWGNFAPEYPEPIETTKAED